MSDAALERAIRDLLAQRQCIRCNAVYTDMDNVGAWQCRWHPGPLQGPDPMPFGAPACTFACCGVAPRAGLAAWQGPDAARGCQPCDHVSGHGMPPPLVIPLDRARILFGDRLVARPGVHVDSAAAEVHVRRFGGMLPPHPLPSQ